MTTRIYSDLQSLLKLDDEFYEALRDHDSEQCLENIDLEELRDTVLERHREGILSIDKTVNVRVLFGCGGPTRYIDFECDAELTEVRSAKYINTAFDEGFSHHREIERGSKYDEYRTEIDIPDDLAQVLADRYMILEGNH